MIAAVGRLRRRVNRRFYRLLFRLYRAVFPTPRWRGSLDPSCIRRILVIRDDRIGDMVVTTPLLSFLRDVAPQAAIDVLASPANAPIAERHPGVTTVFVNDRSWLGWFRVVRRLRRRHYDLVLNPISRKALNESLKASLLAHRDTYKVSGWRPVRYQGLVTGVARVPPQLTHMADRVLYLGQYAFGLTSRLGGDKQYPLRLEVDESAAARVAAFLAGSAIERFVLVNISAGGSARDWLPDRCATFLAQLRRRHPTLSVVLTRAPGMEERVAEVLRRVAASNVTAAPILPLTDFIALVRRAWVVVTPETALIHIASACGRPIVALFGPQHPNDVPLWLPVDVPSRVLASALGGSLNDIDVARVVDAFEDLLREISGARTAAATRSFS